MPYSEALSPPVLALANNSSTWFLLALSHLIKSAQIISAGTSSFFLASEQRRLFVQFCPQSESIQNLISKIYQIFYNQRYIFKIGAMSDTPMTDEEKKNRAKCIIRIINLISGAIMVGFGIGGLIFMAVNNILNAKFFLAFSPIFMILFGLIIIAAECNIERIMNNLGFLQSLIGRGIFNIYLSSTVFYYFSCGSAAIQWLGWVLASIMFAVGIFYIVLYCCCGGKEAQAERDGQKKDIKEQMM